MFLPFPAGVFMLPKRTMSQYLHNHDLFNGEYLRQVVAEPEYPRARELPTDGRQRLKALLELYNAARPRLVQVLPESELPPHSPWTGLPPWLVPLKNVAEAVAENAFIAPVLEQVLGYACDRQKTLELDGLPERQQQKNQHRRPDLILFPDKKTLNAVTRQASDARGVASAFAFCRNADFILDAKRFDRGVETAADVEQMDQYLRGCGKTWGILTDGRSWRLMRAGEKQKHLRFDLVLFLEELRRQDGVMVNGKVKPGGFSSGNLEDFALFYYCFGPPSVGGGYLDLLYREGQANTRRVSDILKENAHQAVQLIAQGFWRYPPNGFSQKPSQDELDHLRELALTLLYRLLFVLKAEAQGLLPMRDENGADTQYAQFASTRAIFNQLKQHPRETLEGIVEGFDRLNRLFELVNAGGAYGIPAYNGGLFSKEIHPELASLRLHDDVIHDVLHRLIYLSESEPVPYADLDVRDFGEIYEGLLEQRLIREREGDGYRISLRNKKGERKASGSYFTPDSLVDHIVRETLNPLMESRGRDPERVLELKIVDPAMGSGHFLVKVVDVMAWHLTLHCDPPANKKAPRDGGPREYEYWKRKVVESCVYGVDINPMAVELARVALWLHTASKGKPLALLEHHLKCGNSLVGADLRAVSRPGLVSREGKGQTVWEPRSPDSASESDAESSGKKSRPQLELPVELDSDLFSGILESVARILGRPSSTPNDVRSKRREYAAAVSKTLKAYRLLCDLWCAQWFLAEPDKEGRSVYESFNGLFARVKKVCGLPDEEARDDAVYRFSKHPYVKKVMAAKNEGHGPRPMCFFHWQLEFPEVAFSPDGQLKEHFGFDAVVGNPPWDKIKPARRDFYGPFDPEVANRQGTSLNARIAEMEAQNPELVEGWNRYERIINRMTAFLSQCRAYPHQVTQVNGKKTGGDPDLFRYFTERALQCARKGGRVGLVVPCTLWQGQGCTGLRRLIFNHCTLHGLYTFENYRKWAFGIHSSFKFSSFLLSNSRPPKDHRFPAAFMLRDTQVLEGLLKARVVKLSADYVKTVSPSSLALIDNRSDGEARFVETVHKRHPALGSKKSGWHPVYQRELDMTNDSWCFKTREWMKERGFTRVLPVKGENGEWSQNSDGPSTARLPADLPDGGEYWIAADPDWYQARGYEQGTAAINGDLLTFFIHPADKDLAKDKKFDPKKDFRRIFPGQQYTALYEGRMVHIFDHCQKRYLQGEGRKAIWEDIPFGEKALQPRVFVCKPEADRQSPPRIGFCDITGASNERSILATLISGGVLAGNTVPCLHMDSIEECLIMVSLLNSFCCDALLRFRISTHLNWVYLSSLVVPPKDAIPPETKTRICQLAARLNCTTPELAEVWEAVFPKHPWSYGSAERDLWARAELRAELDAIVAELYGLSVEEYARVLTGFPLMDRDQPPLPGDCFLTEGDKKSKARGKEGEDWIQTDWGIFELKPRSFITRDFALLTYMKRKDYPIAQKLDDWYRDKAGLDPEGVLSRFRVGEIKDLAERMAAAKAAGAVPYVPTGQGA